MKALRYAALALLLAATAALPLVIRKHGEQQLRRVQHHLRHRAIELRRLDMENQMLSAIAARHRGPETLGREELLELMRLRSEVGQLRVRLSTTDAMQQQIRQLHAGLDVVTAENERGENDPLALLEDLKELRQARLARLKEWLQNQPDELIPELALLSEEDWLNSAGRTEVTEEEHRAWISGLRAQGEKRFAVRAFRALQRFTKEHGGEFPADVSLLKPYFEEPIDGAILQRYEVVPSKRLPGPLAGVGGDWVVTQKVPVNRQFDTRVAIGLSGFRGETADSGRWDLTP